MQIPGGSTTTTTTTTTTTDAAAVVEGVPPQGAVVQDCLILCSSNVPDKDTLLAAVKGECAVVQYDFETATLASIAQGVRAAADDVMRAGGVVNSIGIVCHGGPGNVQLTKAMTISSSNAESEDVTLFFTCLDGCMILDGRIDLLACNVAASEQGQDFVAQLESGLGIDFAASDDVTTVGDGDDDGEVFGDMVLETDEVDTTKIYFDKEKLAQWDGELGFWSDLLGALPEGWRGAAGVVGQHAALELVAWAIGGPVTGIAAMAVGYLGSRAGQYVYDNWGSWSSSKKKRYIKEKGLDKAAARKAIGHATNQARRMKRQGTSDRQISRTLESRKNQYWRMTKEEFFNTRHRRSGTGMGGGRWGDGSRMGW